MTSLDLKLLRDLWHIRGQAMAICLVMACGVATLTMSLSTLSSLEATQASYYERYRFAHVFGRVKRAPLSLAARMAEIPGVAEVQSRIVVDVTLDVPGMPEPAVGRLVSIPERGDVGLNGLHLRGGRRPEPGRGGEVLAGEAFVQAHGLQLGDELAAMIDGHRETLKIVGIALSPEYVYPIRPGELLPDDKRFGVFWMGRGELAAAFDMQGAFDDFSLSLTPGASEAEVVRRLDRLTERYGGLGAHGRADQLSHKFVQNEMTQLRGMASLPPAVFLSVTAFLLHVAISRLIGVQREQIATLKAFGYSRREIGLHYAKLAAVLVVAGVGLGTGVGAWLGMSLTELYTRFFRFPAFEFRLDPGVVLLTSGITAGAAFLGVAGAVRRAAGLPPAAAMQPEPPATYRPALVERLGLGRLLSPQARMILRGLERQPVKSLLTSLGIALSLAVLVLGNCGEDTVEYVIGFQFERAQRQDLTIAFVEPASSRVLHEVERLPGVQRVEPFRSLPVRLRYGHRSRRLGVLGLSAARTLFRLLDVDEREIELPEQGLLISEKLAEVLRCRVGDSLAVEVLEGERPVRQAVVTGLIRDFTDVAAYMDARALHRLMREGDCLSGAFLSVDSDRIDDLYAQLKRLPRVAGVNVKRAALSSFRQTLAENLLRMKAFNVAFASIIAFGVVYNSARISLAERGRELATLRVIGFTRAEISVVLLGELAVLTVAAIPVGLLLGYGFAALLTAALETELQRFPLVVSTWSYGFATTVTLAAALGSGLVVRRRLDRLDLVAVLKSRE